MEANADDQRDATITKTSIQTIDRAVAMLERIGQAGPAGISPSHLAQAAGLLPSTSRSILSSLMAHGFVDQQNDRRYVLGARFLEINRTYAAQVDLATVAAPIIRGVWETTRETVHLSVLRNDRRVELSVLVSPQLLNVNPTGGGTSKTPEVSLLHTAAGKVLMSGLDDDHLGRILKRAGNLAGRDGTVGLREARESITEVREQGYAMNRDADVAGVSGVAAPIFDDQGRVAASLCIGYPTVRRTAAYEEALCAAVVAGAVQVSHLLGAPALRQGENLE